MHRAVAAVLPAPAPADDAHVTAEAAASAAASSTTNRKAGVTASDKIAAFAGPASGGASGSPGTAAPNLEMLAAEAVARLEQQEGNEDHKGPGLQSRSLLAKPSLPGDHSLCLEGGGVNRDERGDGFEAAHHFQSPLCLSLRGGGRAWGGCGGGKEHEGAEGVALSALSTAVSNFLRATSSSSSSSSLSARSSAGSALWSPCGSGGGGPGECGGFSGGLGFSLSGSGGFGHDDGGASCFGGGAGGFPWAPQPFWGGDASGEHGYGGGGYEGGCGNHEECGESGDEEDGEEEDSAGEEGGLHSPPHCRRHRGRVSIGTRAARVGGKSSAAAARGGGSQPRGKFTNKGHDGLFTCPVPGCGKAYPSNNSLWGHKQAKHPELRSAATANNPPRSARRRDRRNRKRSRSCPSGGNSTRAEVEAPSAVATTAPAPKRLSKRIRRR